MTKQERIPVAVRFNKGQIAKFTAVKRKLGRATLSPIIADCAILGLPIFQRMMNGSGEGIE